VEPTQLEPSNAKRGGLADTVEAMWADTAELAALNTAEREFRPYGPSHWAVLAVFAIGSAALVWIGRRQSESQARLLRRVLAALIAAIYGAGLVYLLLPPTSPLRCRCA
jgi:hypothetical protein